MDLARRRHVLEGSKRVWVGIILLFGVLGPIGYLIVGREEGGGEGDFRDAEP